MAEIEIMGDKYSYETSIDNKTMTITDPDTGEWSTWHDDENLVGDPDFYSDWDEWIRVNWEYLDWNEE